MKTTMKNFCKSVCPSFFLDPIAKKTRPKSFIIFFSYLPVCLPAYFDLVFYSNADDDDDIP